jgi:hypothetical protein
MKSWTIGCIQNSDFMKRTLLKIMTFLKPLEPSTEPVCMPRMEGGSKFLKESRRVGRWVSRDGQESIIPRVAQHHVL